MRKPRTEALRKHLIRIIGILGSSISPEMELFKITLLLAIIGLLVKLEGLLWIG